MFRDGLGTFFNEGGWGMWPTLLFGFLLVAASVLFALRPSMRALPPLLSLGAVTLGSAILGTTVGLVTTTHFFAQYEGADGLRILGQGFSESCHNLVLGLIFMVKTGLIITVGLVRLARQPA